MSAGIGSGVAVGHGASEGVEAGDGVTVGRLVDATVAAMVGILVSVGMVEAETALVIADVGGEMGDIAQALVSVSINAVMMSRREPMSIAPSCC
jgi:hypothetical protein